MTRHVSRKQTIRWHAHNSRRAAEARRLRRQRRMGEQPTSEAERALDRQLIDEHIAKHGVTVCPPMTYSGNVDPL